MRLIWTPEDGDKREFAFQPARLLSPEAEAIENVGGEAWESYDEFGQKFMKGNRRAWRAALWVMLRREQPTLKFSDLIVRADEIEIDFDDDEKAKIREAIIADPDIDPIQAEELLRAIDADIGADAGVEPGGKDRSGNGSAPESPATDTGG